MLGDDLLVAPVVTRANATTGLSTKTVWIPGRGAVFFERNAGALVAGGDAPDGVDFARAYALDETPSFARAGAVIPTAPAPKAAAVCSDARRERRSSCGSRCRRRRRGRGHRVRGRRAHDEILQRARRGGAWTTAAWSRDGAGGELAFDATVAGGSQPRCPRAPSRSSLRRPRDHGDRRCDRRRAAATLARYGRRAARRRRGAQRRQRDVVLRRVTRRARRRARARARRRGALGARCAGVSGLRPRCAALGAGRAAASEAKACLAPRARAGRLGHRRRSASAFRELRPRLLATQPPRPVRTATAARRSGARVTALPGAAKGARRDRSARAAPPTRRATAGGGPAARHANFGDDVAARLARPSRCSTARLPILACGRGRRRCGGPTML